MLMSLLLSLYCRCIVLLVLSFVCHLSLYDCNIVCLYSCLSVSFIVCMLSSGLYLCRVIVSLVCLCGFPIVCLFYSLSILSICMCCCLGCLVFVLLIL